MIHRDYAEFAVKYVSAWVLVFFLLLLTGWEPSGEDVLIFFGAFVGMPFATFYGLVLYEYFKRKK